MILKNTIRYAVLAAVMIASPCWAQGTQAQRQACQADAYKWCPTEVPDPEETEACLRQNIKWISSGCQRVFGYKAK
jgi:hypothetical protein